MSTLYNFALTSSVVAVFAFVALFALAPSAHAQATTTDDTGSTARAEMISLIQDLLEQIQDLQERLNSLRGEVHAIIKDGLREGMTDEDIEEIQKLLATDSNIYPEGLVTGYYGPLTKRALARFQERHDLPATGEIDDDTQELLESYLEERFGDNIPQGLLRAPGIQKKVRDRICDDDHRGRGHGLLCKDHRSDKNDDDDSDNDDDKGDGSDSDAFDVEVETEHGSTTVFFSFEGTDYEVMVTSTDEDDVLDAVAEALDVDVEDLNEDLVNEIKDELADKASDEEDGDDSDDDDGEDDDGEDDNSDDGDDEEDDS